MGVKEELNGFKFQYHVVLVLFLNNPKYFVALGCEKNDEDCVLRTVDDKYWYAQCKFSSNRDNANKALMLKGLFDLKAHQGENVESLILATNIYNPFCKSTSFPSRSCLFIKSFNELHSAEKKKLIEYVNGIKKKKKVKNKFDKKDVEDVFLYAYCNYDMPTTTETNFQYLMEKIKEFIETQIDFPRIAEKAIAKDWLRIVENGACKINLNDNDDLINKGCLAGAFCNSTLFRQTFSEVAHKYGFNNPDLEVELSQYCVDNRENFMEETIDISYSIWSNFVNFKGTSSDSIYQLRHSYIDQLTLGGLVPGFIKDSFGNKGTFKEDYQLLVFKYFVACVLENSDLIIKVRKEFGCDN